MKHIIYTHLQELTDILNVWFTSRYNLSRPPVLLSQEFEANKSFYECALQIYKRGVVGLSQDKAVLYSPPPLSGSLIPQWQCMTADELLDFYSTLKNPFVIVDKVFLDFHPGFLKKIKTLLGAKFKTFVYIYEASEETKSLVTVANFVNAMPDDTQEILGIGGGITLDLAGFAAGLTKKDVHFIPTTLLSAVDSATGGKTAANFPPFGKNQVGLFVPITTLTVVPEFFSTLSHLQLSDGLIEAMKHSWIYGTFFEEKFLFEKAKQNANDFFISSEGFDFLFANYIRKAFIISKDPLDKGLRQSLNFGHTIGHVLEALSHEHLLSPLTHGQAVGLGILFLLHTKILKSPEGFAEELKNTLQFGKLHFPLNLLQQENVTTVRKSILRLLQEDKKLRRVSNTVTLSLPPYGYLQNIELQPIDFNPFENENFLHQYSFEVLTDELLEFLKFNNQFV